MAYTLQNAFDDLAGMVHGRSINKITNPLSVARRAANALLGTIDPEDTKRYASITLYDQVTDYNLPMTDLKEKAIFDIRPQVNRHDRDNLSSRTSKDFDMKKGGDNQPFGSFFSVEDDTGTRYIRVLKKLDPGAAAIDSVSDSIEWTASGGATALAQDQIYAVDESGTSLRMNLTANASPGFITSSSITTGDLTDFALVGSFFLWAYLAGSATDVTTFKLRVGSSSANYWEMTGVVHFGVQQKGWNLLRFDWPTATTNGTPDATKVTYSRIEMDYPAAGAAGVRLNKLFVSLPRIWTIGYYSDSLFSKSGVWSNAPADSSVNLNLSVTTYNLYVFELGKAASQQIQGRNGAADRQFFEFELHGNPQTPERRGLYAVYERNNPDQREKVTQTWYGRGGRLAFKRK